ncbi:MAG: ABC transporter permease [Chloroflexota bacterium]|nr:ABC transporter permease [Chloroflexota bacterium]
MKPFNKLFSSALKEFYRDKTALFFSFAFPIIFILIFGLVFGNESIGSYKVGIVSEGNSPSAQMILEVFEQISDSEEMDILDIEFSNNSDTELDRLRNGDIRSLLIIPDDIEPQMLSNSDGGKLEIYYDPSQTTVAQIVLPILQQIVSDINLQMTQSLVLLSVELQSIQAHHVRNIDYMIPGIVAMSILSLGLFSCIPLIQQRQKGILRRLNATPLRKSTMVSSQILFRLILAVLQTAIIILVGWAFFDVQMLGNWLVLGGFVILGALTFVSLGYVIASFVRTEEGAIPIVNAIFMPMMFLSGIFFPVEIMPGFMKPIVMAMPLTYLGDALRQVTVEATPLYPMLIDTLVLVGWMVVCVTISIRFFRWE